MIKTDKKIADYVLKNKFPTMMEILDKIKKEDPDKLKYYAENNINFARDYNEEIHLICKRIYENITNEKIVRECGQILYDKIGFRGMQACFYVLNLYSPLAASTNKEIRHCTVDIQYDWDGIGEWKC